MTTNKIYDNASISPQFLEEFKKVRNKKKESGRREVIRTVKLERAAWFLQRY